MSLHQETITNLVTDTIEPPSIILITEDITLSEKEVIKKRIQSSKEITDLEDTESEVLQDTKPIKEEDGLSYSKT